MQPEFVQNDRFQAMESRANPNVRREMILQAHAYYQMLENDMNSSSSEDNDGEEDSGNDDQNDHHNEHHEDGASFYSDSVANSEFLSDLDESEFSFDLDLSSEDEAESHPPKIAIRAIAVTDLLLFDDFGSSTNPGCTNCTSRKTLWASVPELNLKASGLGFLSQLAHLCLEARIQKCEHPLCVGERNKKETLAPSCNWSQFRDWAVGAMACQAAMKSPQRLSRAHSHLANVVGACSMVLKECRRRSTRANLLRDHLDTELNVYIDVAAVSNVIHWMLTIQTYNGIGPSNFGRWTHSFLPAELSLPQIVTATSAAERLGICKTRLWNLVNVTDRKQSELPEIVAALQSRDGIGLSHPGHELCSPSKCQLSQLDATSVMQMHRCATGDCNAMTFQIDLLTTALEQGKSTAWKCETKHLSGPKDRYLAISHVWSDGTGAGRTNPGTVNTCLFDYFASLAKDLGCNAIWWDVLSVPTEPAARSQALSRMHMNYAEAECTVVHDRSLLEVPWRDDGSPCLALVLSNWFTRGWTALELAKSRVVKVMFKHPLNDGFVMKDLDKDVLADSPDGVSRAFWLATSVIRQLRRPVRNIGDLLSILSTRNTSWARDRTVIAALLADVPDCDFKAGESQIVSNILVYLGRIPYSCLLHGAATMRNLGSFSWSAATLDDISIDSAGDAKGGDSQKVPKKGYLTIDRVGAAEGEWFCREVTEDDITQNRIRPFGKDLASAVKIEAALRSWATCVLLRPLDYSDETPALLAVPYQVLRLKRSPILKCRYCGTVTVDDASEIDIEAGASPWGQFHVRIGGSDSGLTWYYAEAALDRMEELYEESSSGENESDTDEDADKSAESGPLPVMAKQSVLTIVQPQPSYDHPSPNVSQEDTPMYKYRQANSHDIILAIRGENMEAMRYLVAQRIEFDIGVIQKVANLRTLNGIRLFGNALAEDQLHKEAIQVYRVADTYYAKLSDSSISACKAKYSLAKVLMRSGNNEDPEEIASLFKDVRAESEKRAKNKAQKRVKRNDGKQPGTSGAANKGKSDSSDKKRHREDDAWYSLELRMSALETVLFIKRLDFSEATAAFERAMREFGRNPQGNEVFRTDWADRERTTHEHRLERDERASLAYHQALRRFRMMFRSDNILVILTYLHVGVNCALRGKFLDAKEHLEKAVRCLKDHDMCEGTAIISLAQFHLAVLYNEMNKPKEAISTLKEVLKSIPSDDNSWISIAAQWALGESSLNMRPPEWTEAERSFGRVIEQCRKDNKKLKHGFYIPSLVGLAKVFHQRTEKPDPKAAKAICEAAIRLNRSRKGDDNKQDATMESENECHAGLVLGQLFLEAKSLKLAMEETEKSLRGFRRFTGGESVWSLNAQRQLSKVYEKMGRERQQDSVDELTKALKGYQNIFGMYHAQTLKTSWELGQLHFAHGDLESAEIYCSRAYQGFCQTKKSTNSWVTDTAKTLGKVYYERCNYGAAKNVFEKVHAVVHRDPNATGTAKMKAATDLAKALSVFESYEETGQVLRLYQEIIDEATKQPKKADQPIVLNAKVRLADLKREQKQFQVARELIEAALTGYGHSDEPANSNEKLDDRLSIEILEARLVREHIDVAEELDSDGGIDYSSTDRIKDILDDLLAAGSDAQELVYEAKTILGELYLGAEDTAAEGEEILREVLMQRESESKLSQPKTIRIMVWLNTYFTEHDRPEEAADMRKKQWIALKRGHGENAAAMIMYITDPKRVLFDSVSSDEYSGGGSSADHSGSDLWSDEDVSGVSDSDSDEESSESVNLGSLHYSDSDLDNEDDVQRLHEITGDISSSEDEGACHSDDEDHHQDETNAHNNAVNDADDGADDSGEEGDGRSEDDD